MNDKPTRKYNRLKNFDYSSIGDYYITICTKNKQNFFWIDDFKINHADCKNYTSLLNSLGQTAYSVIKRTDMLYNGKQLSINLL